MAASSNTALDTFSSMLQAAQNGGLQAETPQMAPTAPTWGSLGSLPPATSAIAEGGPSDNYNNNGSSRTGYQLANGNYIDGTGNMYGPQGQHLGNAMDSPGTNYAGPGGGNYQIPTSGPSYGGTNSNGTRQPYFDPYNPSQYTPQPSGTSPNSPYSSMIGPNNQGYGPGDTTSPSVGQLGGIGGLSDISGAYNNGYSPDQMSYGGGPLLSYNAGTYSPAPQAYPQLDGSGGWTGVTNYGDPYGYSGTGYGSADSGGGSTG